MPFLPPNQQRQSTEGVLKMLKMIKIIFVGSFNICKYS